MCIVKQKSKVLKMKEKEKEEEKKKRRIPFMHDKILQFHRTTRDTITYYTDLARPQKWQLHDMYTHTHIYIYMYMYIVHTQKFINIYFNRVVYRMREGDREKGRLQCCAAISTKSLEII